MINRDESKSLPAQILEILAEGKFTVRQLADRLGVQSRAEVKQVRDALLEMRLDGRVSAKETEPGRSKLWGLADRRPDIQGKIWRVYVLKNQKGQVVNATGVAILAAASQDYVRRYSRFLCTENFLFIAGRHHNTVIFRIVPGREQETPPHWNRRAEKRRGPETGERRPEPKSQSAPSDTAKFIVEMQEALNDLVDGVKLFTAIFQDLSQAIESLKEPSHDSKDRG